MQIRVVCHTLSLKRSRWPPFFCISDASSSSFECSKNLKKIYRLENFRANVLKDVRAHCYCASLLRTLYMTWRVPRHAFQARAPSRNSTKYIELMTIEVTWSENSFVVCLVTTNFSLGSSLPFLIRSIILKNKRNLYVGSFNYFSCTFQIGSNWYMDTGLRDLKIACFKANSAWLNDKQQRSIK